MLFPRSFFLWDPADCHSRCILSHKALVGHCLLEGFGWMPFIFWNIVRPAWLQWDTDHSWKADYLPKKKGGGGA